MKLLLMLFALALCLVQAATPALKVSANQRFLVTAGGQAFFNPGDTTWELFPRLNREDVIGFLDNRASWKPLTH